MQGVAKLHLQVVGCATVEEMNSNVTATIERGYTGLETVMDSELGKRVHLCGAGPSLRDSYKEIPDGESIFAVNSAIGFMIEHDRPPQWAMIWDASPVCSKFAVPHPDVTYLIGARCHPSVFERLNGCRVIVWYAGGDHNITQYLQSRGMNVPLVNGGTAGVTRGIYLAYALGYRDLHIHGADSCYSDEGDTHVRGSLVPEKSLHVMVGENGKWFRTTPEMCAQIEEMKVIYPSFMQPELGASFKMYGSGMMQHVVSIMEKDRNVALANAQAMLMDAGGHVGIFPQPQSLEPLQGVPA